MDFEVIETGDGGDLIKTPKDISVIDGLENVVYLAMFGGNVKQSTPTVRAANEQAFDWWGNNLIFPGDSVPQFNSETERILAQTPLTSAGRILIENAVKTDLEFVQPFADTTVVVSLIGLDKVIIAVRLDQPDNLQQKDFIYLWDATRSELYSRNSTPKSNIPPEIKRYFDDSFDDSFN